MKTWLLISALFYSNFVLADTVAIRGVAEEGKGYSWLAGEECFVVSPEHVIGFQQMVNVIARNGSEGTAERFVNLGIEGVDVALLKTDNIDICKNEALDLALDLKTILDNAQTSFLEWTDEGVGLSRIRVFIENIDNRELLVRPYYPQDVISQGLSGSTLKIDGKVAGMLVSERNGQGVVYRQNFVASLIVGTLDASVAEQKFNDLNKWTETTNSNVPEVWDRWKQLAQSYPLHIQIAEQAKQWETRFLEKRNSCISKLQCADSIMDGVRLCNSTVEDTNINERSKYSQFRECFKQALKINMCYGTSDRQETKVERRQCDFARPYAGIEEPLPTAYQAIEVIDENVSWESRGKGKYRARFEYAFRNTSEDKVIRCRFRVSGVTLRRSDKKLGSTNDSKSYKLRISPGAETLIEGKVDVKLKSNSFMPSVYRFRTCRY